MRSEIAAHTSSTHSGVAPAARAAVPAAWMTGPSARGSENGTPNSTRSAPASAHAIPMSRDASSEGKPPIRYGISAAVLPWSANAAASRSGPTEDLRQVLVAPPGERHEVERRLLRMGKDPRQRVRRLEGRHDPLEPRHQLEGGDGVRVVDR